MKKIIALLFLALTTFSPDTEAKPQKAATLMQPRVEPTFWWAGMHNPSLQLMVHGSDIGSSRVIIQHPGVIVKSVTSVENPNYLFIDLDLSKAAPGKFDILFQKAEKTFATSVYELKEREPGSALRKGFNSSDVRIDKKWNFWKTTIDLFLDVTNWYVAKNPAIPEYTFKRNAANTAFETTDGLSLKTDGSNAIPTRVKNDDPFVTPTIGIIIEF